MTDATPLFVTLAERALAEADQPANAVSALMTGAAMILDRDFGPEVAGEIMLNMFAECRSTLVGRGLMVEQVQH